MRHPSSTGRNLALPPLISFDSVTDLERTLRESDLLLLEDEDAFRRLTQDGLPPITSPTVLALILGITPKLLTAMAYFPYRYYRAFKIPKRGGGNRRILAPRTFLKVVQHYIFKYVLRQQNLPLFVTGFVAGRGIVTNARLHLKAKYVINTDIKDFFGSIRTSQVSEVFRGLGFPNPATKVLSALCTYKDSLPQGAPTSPSLANLVFVPADETITRFCQGLSIVYSRYADDLTFSRNKPFPKNFIERIREIVLAHGFDLNDKKTRFSKPGQAKYVTGIVVNEKAQPDRRTRRRLRAMFHRAAEEPELFRKRARVLMGWASYMKIFSPSVAARYFRIARAVQSHK